MEEVKKLDIENMIKKAVAKANPNGSPGEIKKFESVMTEVISSGKTPAEAMGFDAVQMEKFYSIGFNLYKSGKFKEALNIFGALVQLDGTQSRHWYGLAACFHKLKNYERAIDFYMTWSFLEPNNPLPFFHASDCCIHLNQKNEAIIFLIYVINRCGDVPEFQKIKEKAKSTQNKLKQEVGWDKKE